MWPGELIRQFLDTGIVCASRKPRARSSAWSLEGALGWGPGLGDTMCKFRSQGWSSTSGPEAGVPIWGARGRCPQPGLVTAGPEGGPGGLTWRIERGQFAGPGVLRAPAPAIRCLILVELRLLTRPVLGARHGHSPGPPGALC